MFAAQNQDPDPKTLLREYVVKQNPNMLVIAWCYSTHGDVCMALRRNAEMSRMVLEAEMRHIGISSAKSILHPKQKEVLKIAQDPKLKVLALSGGLGSGKTVLAVETVKIWMAQHFEEQSLVSN